MLPDNLFSHIWKAYVDRQLNNENDSSFNITLDRIEQRKRREIEEEVGRDKRERRELKRREIRERRE